MSTIDVAFRLSALGTQSVQSAIGGIAGTITRTGETISGAMTRAKDATSGLIERMSDVQKGMGTLQSGSGSLAAVGKALDSSTQSATGLAQTINQVKAAQSGITGAGFTNITTQAKEADEAVRKLRADMAKSNPFTNPGTGALVSPPPSTDSGGSKAGGIIPTVSRIPVAQDDDPVVAAFRAQMAQSNPFINPGTGAPVAPPSTASTGAGGGAGTTILPGDSGGAGGGKDDPANKTLSLMSLHMVGSTFYQWGRSALGFADSLSKISQEAEGTQQRLAALLEQQNRSQDLPAINQDINFVVKAGHVANPSQVREAAIQMSSDEVRTQDMPQLLEAAVRNAQTLKQQNAGHSIEQIGVAFSKAYGEGSLNRLKRVNILFTEQEQASVAAAYGISKAAGQTEFMRVVMAATNRDTAELGAGLTETQKRANDAARAVYDMSVQMGQGAQDAKTSISEIGAHLLSLINASPQVAKAAGAGLEWSGYIMSSAGGLIGLLAQLAMIRNFMPELGATSILNFAKMRMAGVQAFLAIDVAGAPLWAIIAAIAVVTYAGVRGFQAYGDAGSLSADKLIKKWGILGQWWVWAGDKLARIGSLLDRIRHPFGGSNEAMASKANDQAYVEYVAQQKRTNKPAMSKEAWLRQQQDDESSAAPKVETMPEGSKDDYANSATSSTAAAPSLSMSDIARQMQEFHGQLQQAKDAASTSTSAGQVALLSGGGSGSDTSAEGIDIPAMPSGGILNTMNQAMPSLDDYRALQLRAKEGSKGAKFQLGLDNLQKSWAKEDAAAARKAERERTKTEHSAAIEAGIAALGDGSADVGQIEGLRSQLREAHRKKDAVESAVLSERIARAEDAARELRQVNSADKAADRSEKKERLFQLQQAHEAQVYALRGTIAKANRKDIERRIHDLNVAYEQQRHAIEGGAMPTTSTGTMGLVGIASAGTQASMGPSRQQVAQQAFDDAQTEVEKAEEEFSKAQLEAAKLMERAARSKYAEGRQALIESAIAVLDKADAAKQAAENKRGWAASDLNQSLYSQIHVGLSVFAPRSLDGDAAYANAQLEAEKADTDFKQAQIEAADLMKKAAQSQYADARRALIRKAEAILDKAQTAKDNAEEKLSAAASEAANRSQGGVGEGYSREARARQEAWARGDLKGAGVYLPGNPSLPAAAGAMHDLFKYGPNPLHREQSEATASSEGPFNPYKPTNLVGQADQAPGGIRNANEPDQRGKVSPIHAAASALQSYTGAGDNPYSGTPAPAPTAEPSGPPPSSAPSGGIVTPVSANFATTVQTTPDEILVTFKADPVRIKRTPAPRRALTGRDVRGAVR